MPFRLTFILYWTLFFYCLALSLVMLATPLGRGLSPDSLLLTLAFLPIPYSFLRRLAFGWQVRSTWRTPTLTYRFSWLAFLTQTDPLFILTMTLFGVAVITFLIRFFTLL